MKYMIVVILMLASVAVCFGLTTSPYIVYPLDATGATLTEAQSNAAFVDASNLVIQIEQAMRTDGNWSYGKPRKTVRGEWAIAMTPYAATLVPAHPITQLSEDDFPHTTSTATKIDWGFTTK